jgi:hypothetical protein
MQMGFEVAADRRSGGLNIEAGLKQTNLYRTWLALHKNFS